MTTNLYREPEEKFHLRFKDVKTSDGSRILTYEQKRFDISSDLAPTLDDLTICPFLVKKSPLFAGFDTL